MAPATTSRQEWAKLMPQAQARKAPALTEEKNSQKTPPSSRELASNEASDFEKFTVADREIYDDTDNWVDHWNDVILPKVYRMREFLSQRGSMHVAGGLLPSWGQWRDRYIEFLKRRMKTSKSTLERQLFKFQLTQGGDDNCDGIASGSHRKSNGGSGSAKTDAELPEAKLLAEARAQFGRAAAAGDEKSAAIIEQYEAEYESAKAEKDAEHPSIDRDKLVSIVETGEKYIRALERVLYSPHVNLTKEQRSALQRPMEAWRKILRDVRGMKVVQVQTRESAA